MPGRSQPQRGSDNYPAASLSMILDVSRQSQCSTLGCNLARKERKVIYVSIYVYRINSGKSR